MQEIETIQLNIPAMHKYLNVVGACLAEVMARIDNLPEAASVTYNVQLAVHEICTNIVEHAYGNIESNRITITMSLAEQLRRLEVELHDTGSTFDLTAVRPPAFDTLHEGGYGLFLVRELMDEVTYDPQPGNNRWRLTKYF
jgi:serine/threonine-protein kinase RsbW